MSRYDNRDVAHAWAHGHGSEGQGSNFFFDGRTIYSYGRHFPIATIDGANVYFTTQKYSKSTGKHKAYALNAVSHKNIVYVHDVPVFGNPRTDEGFHRKNLDHWMSDIEADLKSLQEHPRKRALINSVHRTVSKIQEFITLLDITPTGKVKALLSSGDIEQLQAAYAQQEKKEERKRKRQAAEAKKKYLVDLGKWENHQLSRVSAGGVPKDLANLAYLRLSSDQSEIETSKGISVPIDMAKRFYQFIVDTLPAGCEECKYSILNCKFLSKVTQLF